MEKRERDTQVRDVELWLKGHVRELHRARRQSKRVQEYLRMRRKIDHLFCVRVFARLEKGERKAGPKEQIRRYIFILKIICIYI